MFKKLVSHLPFSPSLIGELGFYAKRLRKEEATRRIGLILTAFALVVQLFISFAPPESANAANANDILYGGVKNKSQILAAWDNNTQGFRDIMTYAGITRDNLAQGKEGRSVEIHSRNGGRDAGWRSWGRLPRFGAQRGEVAHRIGDMTVYSRPLSNSDTGRNVKGTGSWYPALMGTNSLGQPFAIIKGCGNLAMKEDPKPKPQPKNMTVCRLADKKYPVTIREDQFNTALHSKNPEDCKPKPKPLAQCTSLVVKPANSRTAVEVTVDASVAGGAAVNGYTVIFTNNKGKEVARKSVKTTALSTTFTHNLTDAGTYTVEAIAETSLGAKKSDGCKTTVAIKEIERCPLNPALPINHPDCQPCLGDPTLWAKDARCTAQIIRRKSVKNLTSGKDATTEKAKASERIEYTITAKNEGKDEASVQMSDDLSDVLEYASLYDRGGATLDERTKTLVWPKITLKPGQQQTRTYVVQVSSKLSPLPQGASERSSGDCRMTNTFGTSTDVHVDCPPVKVVESVVTQLPKTGPGETMIIAGIVTGIVTFLYFRSRQLGKEVRLIRREMTAGTL